jgi:hypothetical protein
MTTPRMTARTRRAAVFLAFGLLGLTSLAGCDPRTLFYFLQPWEPTIPAPGPSLSGKKIVVVSHAVSTTQGEFQALDHELTREVVKIFRDKVKKIEITPPEKVWTWVEAHPSWTDPAELARAFDADIVIYMEVEAFQLQNPSDLNVFHGEAKTHIVATELVYPKNSKGKDLTDKPKEPKTIYDDYADSEFPRTAPIPYDSGVSRGAFKNRFLKVVANEVSWRFVEHAPEDDVEDSKFGTK